MPEFQEFIAPYKGLISPIGTGTGTGTGKEKRGSTEGEKRKPKSLNLRNGLVDSEWIAGVKQNPAYAGIDVDRELNKCVEWFKVKGITPTRQRFLNWINKADKPLQTRGKAQQKFKDIN